MGSAGGDDKLRTHCTESIRSNQLWTRSPNENKLCGSHLDFHLKGDGLGCKSTAAKHGGEDRGRPRPHPIKTDRVITTVGPQNLSIPRELPTAPSALVTCSIALIFSRH